MCANAGAAGSPSTTLRFQVFAPRVDAGHHVAVVGNIAELGSWDVHKAIRLNNSLFPLWTVEVPLASARHLPAQYKYVIVDARGGSNQVVQWETGHNRLVDEAAPESGGSGDAGAGASTRTPDTLVVTDNEFRLQSSPWRGAGVAVPVFSLRTRSSMGVGEFLDLKVLVDCAVASGLQLIQLLPINDTCIEGDWRDTYPYKSISVVALHPQYCRITAIPNLPRAILDAATAVVHAGAAARPEPVDYDTMIVTKLRFLREAFAAIGYANERCCLFCRYV